MIGEGHQYEGGTTGYGFERGEVRGSMIGCGWYWRMVYVIGSRDNVIRYRFRRYHRKEDAP